MTAPRDLAKSTETGISVEPPDGKVTAQQLAAPGKKWAATEEFSPKFDNWLAEAVHQVLGELAALCKRAGGEGKSVLMWWCL
jgi:hypothetical protein